MDLKELFRKYPTLFYGIGAIILGIISRSPFFIIVGIFFDYIICK